MRRDEFIEKLLNGERDFAGIKLEEHFNLKKHKKYKMLQDYLLRSKLWEEPIVLDAADLRFLKAEDIYWPFTHAEFADFTGADLQNANLFKACFTSSNFFEAQLRLANLRFAQLAGANLD